MGKGYATPAACQPCSRLAACQLANEGTGGTSQSDRGLTQNRPVGRINVHNAPQDARIAERIDFNMSYKVIVMEHDKKIALVAHDNKKRDLLEWAKFNRDLLAHHEVYATGTTGSTLERELGFPIRKLQSGPLGGDQQIGAKIVDNEIDFLIFFWDPLEPNRASADFMISSGLMDGEYERLIPDYDTYRARKIELRDEPAVVPVAEVPQLSENDVLAELDELLATAA